MTTDHIFETFAKEFDLFLDMNPDLSEADLTPRQRAWLEDFCARFDHELEKAA